MIFPELGMVTQVGDIPTVEHVQLSNENRKLPGYWFYSLRKAVRSIVE